MLKKHARQLWISHLKYTIFLIRMGNFPLIYRISNGHLHYFPLKMLELKESGEKQKLWIKAAILLHFNSCLIELYAWARQNDTYRSDNSKKCESVVDPHSNVNMFDFTEYFETDNPMIFFKGEQTKT